MNAASILAAPFDVLGGYVLPFLLVLTLIVFVHEFGHFIVARWCKVDVEVFSIGFGREIYGWQDRHGTRWKVCWLPLGGYVKFAGDANAASLPSREREGHGAAAPGDFHGKPVWQRAAVVVAGPVANYLLAIAIFFLTLTLIGVPVNEPKVNAVRPGGAAAQAGILPGDIIRKVNGEPTASFEDVQRIVAPRAGQPLSIVVERAGRPVETTVTPVETEIKSGSATVKIGLIGIERTAGGPRNYLRQSPGEALETALERTWFITSQSVLYVGRMLSGHEGTGQLAGPLGIAEMTGRAASLGLFELLQIAAVLSVSIGLINLFPIPMLDGGHLLYYAIEAVRGRPLGQEAQEFGFKLGFALVLTLMVFATWNDIVRFVSSWVSS
ncbi:MAG: RIP metalloprotease RseP [Aestuariivirgaceae bacterium]|jgi:regulator of sigma E protease